jgi:hypothetical protein
MLIRTVRKPKRDIGPQHEGDGKFSHPHRLSGPIYFFFLKTLLKKNKIILYYSTYNTVWSCQWLVVASPAAPSAAASFPVERSAAVAATT